MRRAAAAELMSGETTLISMAVDCWGRRPRNASTAPAWSTGPG